MTLSDSSSPSPWFLSLKQAWRSVLKAIADLRLAIILLLLIAIFSISGTVIEQGETLSFYQANYPEDPALFGFLSWQLVLVLGLNHVYSTWWYLALLVLFGTCLLSCTFVQQLPTLKVARKTFFQTSTIQFKKQKFNCQAQRKQM